MADAAQKRWTVEEFLDWDDGTDRRYELVDGLVVAMAPPSEAHATIVMNLGTAIRHQLRPPCRVLGEFGVRIEGRDDSLYQFDPRSDLRAGRGQSPIRRRPGSDRRGALPLDPAA
jgi:Uma2 family endonuclease